MPRFGTENPTRHDNPLWASLVHERINAWQVNTKFGYERVSGDAPTWCFDRFGMTETQLIDGRTLYISGEHEDYYDPDFYIYNDVVTVAPDGTVAIYGYPREVFPPTDFHSATLDGDRIWIVGSLGYPSGRAQGTTQVCRLDLRTFAIERFTTTGEPPGWIHQHAAELADGTLEVRGGVVEQGGQLHENIDDWALDLTTLVWTRRTRRDWQRFVLRRVDRKRSFMWEIRQMQWQVDHPEFQGSIDYRGKMIEELGAAPDLAQLDALYRFDGAAQLQQAEDEYNVFRIVVDGKVVRFTEEQHRITAVTEGRISDERLHALQQHVLTRLHALHVVPWDVEQV